MKRCSGCGEQKALSGYHRDRGGVMGRKARCKKCALKRQTELKRTAIKLGTKAKRSKFTAQQVYDVVTSGELGTVIAERFGIHTGTLYRWKNGHYPNEVAEEVDVMLMGTVEDNVRSTYDLLSSGTARFARDIDRILSGELRLIV